MTLLATSIPGSSNNGYVAAAYIVFFAIVVIYVAIMALRLTRVERGLRELNEREQQARQEEILQARERETV
jgi:heme exporter protein D